MKCDGGKYSAEARNQESMAQGTGLDDLCTTTLKLKPAVDRALFLSRWILCLSPRHGLRLNWNMYEANSTDFFCVRPISLGYMTSWRPGFGDHLTSCTALNGRYRRPSKHDPYCLDGLPHCDLRHHVNLGLHHRWSCSNHR